MPPFRIASEFRMTGDQPQAVDHLVGSLETGAPFQTLMGVTGSGKTFTMANIVERVQRTTLVMAHNKTLAAQLATEFREFFPDNAVEYFVSYYDYYQPEAYVPHTDTYIEKETEINEEIDRLRHAATRSLLTRRDTLIVASVSCIYGLGDPQDYLSFVATVEKGERRSLHRLIRSLVDMQYERNDLDFRRGTFRVRGDTLDVFPAYEELGVRISFWGDEVEGIVEMDPLTGEVLAERSQLQLYPAKHWVTPMEKMEHARQTIQEELAERWPGCASRARCWRRPGWSPAADTTWRCCKRWATAPASRTTRGTSAPARRAARRGRCSTTSRTTSCCSSTSRT